MKKKYIAFLFASLFLTAVLFTACSDAKAILPIEFVQTQRAEPAHPSEVIGYADYMFVGKVTRILGTEYLFPAEKAGHLGTPATNYEIEVLRNIKGALKPGAVYARKMGGISTGEKTIVLFNDGDFFPLPGGIYIFIANAPDGTPISLNGPHNHIPVFTPEEAERQEQTLSMLGILETQAELLKVIENEAVYKEYIEYYKHEIPHEWEHSMSVFDVHYKGEQKATIPAAEKGAEKLAELLPGTPQYEASAPIEQTSPPDAVGESSPPKA